MQTFIGTKTVLAMAMTRGDYNRYRGWTIPADENPEDAGYLVEYTDGGKPNCAGHDGYISWSPADVFERSYRPGGTFLDRMTIEGDELGERLQKLVGFMATPGFVALAELDRDLMHIQSSAMTAYLHVLAMRRDRAKQLALPL